MKTTTGYLRGQQAADFLGISLRTLRDWQRRRLLKAYKPTKRTCLFKASDLEAAMERFATR